MAITQVGGRITNVSGSVSTGVNIPPVGDAEPGDFVTGVIMLRSTSVDISGAGIPDGWVKESTNDATAGAIQFLFTRVVEGYGANGPSGATEPVASFDWSPANVVAVWVVFYTWRGVDTSNPILVSGTQGDGTTSTSIVAPTMSPSSAGLAVYYWAAHRTSSVSTATITAPAGLTISSAMVRATSASGWWGITGALEVPSGGIGTKTATASIAPIGWRTMGVVLREAGGADPQDIAPQFLSSTATVFGPTIYSTVNLVPALLTSTATVAQPSISTTVNLTPALIASTSTVGQPTLTAGPVTLTPAFIASTATVGQPTLSSVVTVAPQRIESTATVAQPSISTTVSVTPALLASTATVFEPQVTPGAVAITPQRIESTATVGEPEIVIDGFLVPQRIASTAVVFGPTVSAGPVVVEPQRIESTAIVGEPSVGMVVHVELIASGSVVGEPTVTLGAVTIEPALITSGAVVFGPTVVREGVLEPERIESTATVYQPSVLVGPVTIFPATIDVGSVIFEPSLSTSVTLSMQRIEPTSTVGQPSVFLLLTVLSPERIESTATVFPPSVGQLTELPGGAIVTLRHDIKVRVGDTWGSPTWAVLLPGGVGVDLTDGWTLKASVRRHRADGGATVHTWEAPDGVILGQAEVTLSTGEEVTTSTVELHHDGDESEDWPIFVGPWDFEISKNAADYTIAAGTFRTVREVTQG